MGINIKKLNMCKYFGRVLVVFPYFALKHKNLSYLKLSKVAGGAVQSSGLYTFWIMEALHMSVLHKSWVYDACYNLWNINWSHDSCRSNWFYSVCSFPFSLLPFLSNTQTFPNNCMKPLCSTLLWLEGIALEVKRLSWLRKFGSKKSTWSWKWVSCPGSSRSARKVGHCQLSLKSDDTAECLNRHPLTGGDKTSFRNSSRFPLSCPVVCRTVSVSGWIMFSATRGLDGPMVNVLMPLQ